MSRQNNKRCYLCGKQGIYNSKYDSMYCDECNMWLHDACGNEKCEYCNSRPVSPVVDNEIINMIDNLVEEL